MTLEHKNWSCKIVSLRIKEPKLSQTFYLKRDISTNSLSHCQSVNNTQEKLKV